MSCPTSTETQAVFDENSGYQTAYIIFTVFVGISTITTWIFYTRVGIQGIILNVIYTVGFLFCIIGIAANSWISILIFTISLIIDILGAIMMTCLLFADKLPEDLLQKFPFTPTINKIIFPSFATSQTVIVIVLCVILDSIFAKC
mmetsp:Transcript_17814/g.28455  ORF Transcript_17814/g.28455 Transcript_17814/m.28455 type:complete len:145 (-) Transcript_17814:26-460(-)